jgi:hypothetical protein
MTAKFAQCLAEAVAWCSRRARADDAGSSTRTPGLKPPVMARRGYDLLKRLLGSPAETTAAVEYVCQARRRELARLNIPVAPVGPDLSGGRVLFTTIDTDSCEAATGPSNGYYDLDDLPGWDTWFFHARADRPWGAIYCWVPRQLVELAKRGMDVIPATSVEWASSLEVQAAEPLYGLRSQ